MTWLPRVPTKDVVDATSGSAVTLPRRKKLRIEGTGWEVQDSAVQDATILRLLLGDTAEKAEWMTLTGTDGAYVLSAQHRNKILDINDSGTTPTFTVNQGAFAPGHACKIINAGTGLLTLVQGSGVTIRKRASQTFKFAEQESSGILVCKTPTIFHFEGDLGLA